MMRFIENLKQKLLIKLFTIYLRYLIGFAFIFASIVKIKGERFTRLPPTDPVGYFFEAMYQSGFYWNFLGWSQFITATLLMTQRFATLGAVTFFPVVLNVFMITVSIGFRGTPVITGLMLLANIYLLVWDYQRLKVLLQPQHTGQSMVSQNEDDHLMSDITWVYTGLALVVVTALPLSLDLPRLYTICCLSMIPVISIAGLIIGLRRHRRSKTTLFANS